MKSTCSGKISALSFKEISIKNYYPVGGGVSINGIYYTIFSKVLCFAVCSNLFPHEESHVKIYSENTWQNIYTV